MLCLQKGEGFGIAAAQGLGWLYECVYMCVGWGWHVVGKKPGEEVRAGCEGFVMSSEAVGLYPLETICWTSV